MDLTIIIPLLNEAESLPELHNWIHKALKPEGLSFEILFIDDGSTDDSWQVISSLCQANPSTKGIRFLRNFGKSQALHAGFAAAKGEVVFTMDADLQDSPDELPAMYNRLKEEELYGETHEKNENLFRFGQTMIGLKEKPWVLKNLARTPK